MESITYYELKTNIESIQRIEKFRVIENVNEHAYLYLSAVLDPKYKDEYVKRNTEDKVIEVYAESGDGSNTILFKGMVKSEEARCVQDIYYLELEGISFSFLTDIKRKSRSYQDTTLNYKETFKNIMNGYSDWDIQDTASKGANLSRLYVQYEETDWQFLKRLASQFHKGVLPSITYDGIKLVFGTRKGKLIGKIEEFNYYVSKDVELYQTLKQNKLPELKLTDAMIYHIESRGNYEIGDVVQYQDKELYIHRKESEMVSGEVRFHYELTSKNGFLQEEIGNSNIVGVSIQGTVLERIQDRIKVHLSIDKEQDKGKAWEFQYTTPYTASGHSGWYCMPEIGDTVNIYFPEKDEQYAVGLSSIRETVAANDKVTDPDVKYFRTADGKELMMSKDEIRITCCESSDSKSRKDIYIRLNQSDGIQIVSAEPIHFYSSKGITMQAEEEINIIASDKIKLTCKTSEIAMDSNIDICSSDVRIN